jgi:hypothetical protein
LKACSRRAAAIGGLTAFAALLAGASAWSQTLELETGAGWQLNGTAAASDGGLWLLTSIEQSRSYRRFSLIKITPDLALEYERWVPPTMPRGIVAFRDGVLTIQGQERPADFRNIPDFEDSYHLAWLQDDLAARSRSLFSWQSGDGPTAHQYVAVAPDQGAIYLMAANRSEPAIVRLGPDGTLQWRRELGEGQFQDLVATHEGVVAVLNFSQGRRRLVAISEAGEPLWETGLTIDPPIAVDELAYIPPQTLVVVPQVHAEETQTLLLVDTRDRSQRTMTLPARLANIQPVSGGMLLSGYALDQLLLARLGEDGTIKWTERLQLRIGARFDRAGQYWAFDALALGPNAIAIIAGWDDVERNRHARIDRSDPEARALADRYGACLEADAAPIVEREREILQNYGIRVQLGSWEMREMRALDARGCALPSDADYLLFLTEFSAELELLAANNHDRQREAIDIFVDMLDVPYRLIDYGWNQAILDAAGTNLRYIAAVGSAETFARHIANTVQPHLQRMRSHARAFIDDWGCSMSVRGESAVLVTSEADIYLDGLEEAGFLIVEAASRIEPPIPPESGRGCGTHLIFDEDSFSIGDEGGPVRDARRILRAFADSARP